MNIGFVVNTRMDSSRLPNKCALKINGLSILEHLHSRLAKTGLPIIYAYPVDDRSAYDALFRTFKDKNFKVFEGYHDDPMMRMYMAALCNDLDAVIRVTHDKIFVDERQIASAVDRFKKEGVDYLWGNFTDGTAFEIISKEILFKATYIYKNVERITYAIKQVTDKSFMMPFVRRDDIRLLIDYPEDVDLMNAIFGCLGNDCSLNDVLKFMDENPWSKNINKMPDVTIYTCAYNADQWIYETIVSVIDQSMFDRCEYLLVDDHSTDRSPFVMNRFSSEYGNVRYVRNNKNVGLSSSSNVALKYARGKFVLRIDADDYFTSRFAIEQLYEFINATSYDVVYPSNYHGSFDKIQSGSEVHHVGGSMFKKSSLDFVRFTDDIRNYEGYDLFLRTKDMFNIGYFNKPLFLYRQHDDSMSKTNDELRSKEKAAMEMKYGQ